MELEGFDKRIKWIVVDHSGLTLGFKKSKPEIVDTIAHSYWKSEEVVDIIPFTLDWPTDDWTKYVYEREKDKKDMIGEWGSFGDSKEEATTFGVLGEIDKNNMYVREGKSCGWNYFTPLTAEDLRAIKEANGIKETI